MLKWNELTARRLQLLRTFSHDPDFTSEYLPDRLKFLNILQDLGLVTVRQSEEDDQTHKFIQMHWQVRSAVIASFSELEWALAPASHIPRTIYTLCHSFMQLTRDRIPDFYANAKSVGRHLDAIIANNANVAPKDSSAGSGLHPHINLSALMQMSSLRSKENPDISDATGFGSVKGALDTFARYLDSRDWDPVGLRKQVQYVFEQVAGGDLDAVYEVFQYVNVRRGDELRERSRGSMPSYWYVYKEPSAQDRRYD